MAHPWLTSNEIIQTIKRKIAMPIDQSLFSDDDLLAFVNEELALSQVPSILELHEEYLVYTKEIPITTNISRYSIPDRAIGMKLRDLFWQDSSNNIFKMTQCSEEDKALFQRNLGAGNSIQKYYIEGNDIVLTPTVTANPAGSLLASFFLRPNQLVVNSRAAIVSAFCKNVTVDNASLAVGDTLSMNNNVILTAVSGSPASGEFQIGANSTITATNLATAINNLGVGITSNNGTPSSSVVTITYNSLQTVFSSSSSNGLSIQTDQCVSFTSVPSNITNNSYIDFLQTKPGHKIRSYEILVPSNGVSGNTITFSENSVPVDLLIGDYVCSENECIIPQIPPDLHNGLAERACARILASMGDMQGLQAVNEKIQDIDKRQGTLLDNRVDGSPRKVVNRYSLLSWGSLGNRRRF